jgi:hypothetical protein
MHQPRKTVHAPGKAEFVLIRVCVTMLLSSVLISGVRADDDIPTGFKTERYQRVWERNPFTLVTPVSQQAQPTVFDKLVLVSWMKAGSKDIVLVQNTDTNEVQKVTKEANSNNFQLIEIRANQNPQMVEAVLSNGTEKGSIKFKMDAGAAAQPGPPIPNGIPIAGQNPPQPPVQNQGQTQLPNGMNSTQGGLQQPPNPEQAIRQQAQQNANQMIQGSPPIQGNPAATQGTTPARTNEIRRKRLAPPNSN